MTMTGYVRSKLESKRGKIFVIDWVFSSFVLSNCRYWFMDDGGVETAKCIIVVVSSPSSMEQLKTSAREYSEL